MQRRQRALQQNKRRLGLEAHEASTHNTDTTARTTAEQAQAGLEAHEASTHNTDAGARTAAAGGGGNGGNGTDYR